MVLRSYRDNFQILLQTITKSKLRTDKKDLFKGKPTFIIRQWNTNNYSSEDKSETEKKDTTTLLLSKNQGSACIFSLCLFWNNYFAFYVFIRGKKLSLTVLVRNIKVQYVQNIFLKQPNSNFMKNLEQLIVSPQECTVPPFTVLNSTFFIFL